MAALPQWTRLPSQWILDGGLKDYRWGGPTGRGSDNIAALMVLMTIAHHIDGDTGIAKLTYADIGTCTGLSKTKISNGLQILARRQIIERHVSRSVVELKNYGPTHRWAKLPARRMYEGAHIRQFQNIHLRSHHELNALKLYFLFTALRDNEKNIALISYDKIPDYTGIERGRIRAAISMLASINLVHVERFDSAKNEGRMINAYRLVGLDGYINAGTRPAVTVDFENG